MSGKTTAHLVAEAKAPVIRRSPQAVMAQLASDGVRLVDLSAPDARGEHGTRQGPGDTWVAYLAGGFMS